MPVPEATSESADAAADAPGDVDPHLGGARRREPDVPEVPARHQVVAPVGPEGLQRQGVQLGRRPGDAHRDRPVVGLDLDRADVALGEGRGGDGEGEQEEPGESLHEVERLWRYFYLRAGRA